MNRLLILPPRATEDSQLVWRAAIKEGVRTERLRNWDPTGLDLGDYDSVFGYGESLFLRAIADKLGFRLIEPNFNWLPGLPEIYRKREVRLMKLKDLEDLDEAFFVKPTDEKIFDAGVYRNPSELIERDFIERDLPILVSEIIELRSEFRCFVKNRKLMGFSVYARNGEYSREADGSWYWNQSEESRGLDFLKSLLKDKQVDIPSNVVIDIGESERGWTVIEANPCWGSGIYGCDPVGVLNTLDGSMTKDTQQLSVGNDR